MCARLLHTCARTACAHGETHTASSPWQGRGLLGGTQSGLPGMTGSSEARRKTCPLLSWPSVPCGRPEPCFSMKTSGQQATDVGTHRTVGTGDPLTGSLSGLRGRVLWTEG